MKLSLGVVLAVCLAGLQFLAVFAVVMSSYFTSEKALLEHARSLLSDVATNTIEHSKGFLTPARGAAELAARLAENQIVSSNNSALLEKLLFQQLQQDFRAGSQPDHVTVTLVLASSRGQQAICSS